MSDDSAMEEGRLEEDGSRVLRCDGCGTIRMEGQRRSRLGGDHCPWVSGRPRRCGQWNLFLGDRPLETMNRVDLSNEIIALRAENDALKQQLQTLREQDHMCRELVQEIADSKICWSDWAGDYIQWTEDITRKARKALGLKDE